MNNANLAIKIEWKDDILLGGNFKEKITFYHYSDNTYGWMSTLLTYCALSLKWKCSTFDLIPEDQVQGIYLLLSSLRSLSLPDCLKLSQVFPLSAPVALCILSLLEATMVHWLIGSSHRNVDSMRQDHWIPSMEHTAGMLDTRLITASEGKVTQARFSIKGNWLLNITEKSLVTGLQAWLDPTPQRDVSISWTIFP